MEDDEPICLVSRNEYYGMVFTIQYCDFYLKTQIVPLKILLVLYLNF